MGIKKLGGLLGLLALPFSNLALANQSCDPHFPGWHAPPQGKVSEVQMVGYQTRQAVLEIAQHIGMPQKVEGPILTTTPANLQNLQKTSELGQLIASEATSCLAQLGFFVQEARARKDSILVRNQQGRFVLSRSGKELADRQNAKALLVGTYFKQPNGARVNLRLLRASDNKILGSASYWLGQHTLHTTAQ